METINAIITVFDKNGNPRRKEQIAAHSTVQILKHIEWEHLTVKNWGEIRYDIALYAQEKYDATKIVIEYHFEDGDITTETITTLEK